METHVYVANKLKKIFDTARIQTGNQNLVESAKKLYSKVDDKDLFLEEFICVLKYCLIYPDKGAADKILTFVSKFVASLYSSEALLNESDEDSDTENPFVNGLLHFLSKMHWAAAVEARVRCVTLISYILTAMPENSLIPVEMWKTISDTVRSRLQDKNAQVRVAAVMAARKLQEPKNPKCEILKLLAFHISDPSPAVRRSVVSSIALTKATISLILGRTLDVNENVRRNAFAVVAKVRFVNLAIALRVTFLERGLKDRSERVRNCVGTVVIPQWLGHVNRNVLQFLEQIDAVNCPAVAAQALEAIFRTEPIEEVLKCLPLDPESHCIPHNKLTPETALLWRCLTEHFMKKELLDELEAILPSLTAFCDVIKGYYPMEPVSNRRSLSGDEQWAEIKQKRVLEHLLEMAKVFDLKDEVGRSNLRRLICSLLICPRVGEPTVAHLIQLLPGVVSDTNDLLQTLIEAVSEVREPLTQVNVVPNSEELLDMQLKLSGYKTTLNDLQEKEYEAVQAKDYAAAAALKDEIEAATRLIDELNTQPSTNLLEVREEKTDPETMCKCLSIIVNMLKVSGICSITPALRTLQEEFISNCLRSDDLLTQSLAVQALAQLCILDKSLAQDHLLGFLFMLSETGDNEVNIPALKAVFDIFQTHGVEPFANLDETRLDESSAAETSKGKTLLLDDDEVLFNVENVSEPTRSGGKCISLLKELLNCTTNDQLKRTAFEGFCKILVTGGIYSPSLLKTVIIKGFTPIRDNESEDRIRQMFMVFFPIFARKTVRSQEMIEAAFIPVMRTLNDAQLGSPEVDINARDVAAFLLDHTRPGINPHTVSTVHVHNSLAISICLEILRDVSLCVDLGFDQNYFKALFHLNVGLENEVFAQQLFTLVAKICKEVTDSTSLRLAKIFRQKLLDSLPSDTSSVQNTLRTTRQTSIDSISTSRDINGLPEPLSRPSRLQSLPEAVETADETILENSTSSDRPVAGGVVEESTEVSDDSMESNSGCETLP